jgi:hypothetical protein
MKILGLPYQALNNWIRLHDKGQLAGKNAKASSAEQANCPETQACEALLVHTKAMHAKVKGEYGWPEVWAQLLANGLCIRQRARAKLPIKRCYGTR